MSNFFTFFVPVYFDLKTKSDLILFIIRNQNNYRKYWQILNQLTPTMYAGAFVSSFGESVFLYI